MYVYYEVITFIYLFFLYIRNVMAIESLEGVLEVSGNIDISGSIHNILDKGTIMLYCGDVIPKGWELVNINDKFLICCDKDKNENIGDEETNTQIEITNDMIPKHRHNIEVTFVEQTHEHTISEGGSHNHTDNSVLKKKSSETLVNNDVVKMNNNWEGDLEDFIFASGDHNFNDRHPIYGENGNHTHTVGNANHKHSFSVKLKDNVTSDNKEKVDIIPEHMKLLYIRYIG